MSRQPSTVEPGRRNGSTAAEVTQLHAATTGHETERGSLHEALEEAEQCFEVALAIVDMLSDHVEDHDGLRRVIAEVVRAVADA